MIWRKEPLVQIDNNRSSLLIMKIIVSAEKTATSYSTNKKQCVGASSMIISQAVGCVHVEDKVFRPAKSFFFWRAYEKFKIIFVFL